MHTTATAVRTTDRYGASAYAWSDGTHIVRDGAGRMVWSLYRAGNGTNACDYFTTTLTDALANV